MKSPFMWDFVPTETPTDASQPSYKWLLTDQAAAASEQQRASIKGLISC